MAIRSKLITARVILNGKIKRKEKVSVIIVTRNDGMYIRECIQSILQQTHNNFELIIHNDASTDDSDSIIRSFSDKRIRYYKHKKASGSIGRIRNEAFTESKEYKINGRYVFVTDGDCHAEKDWLEKGLVAFKKYKTAAIEGRIIYNYRGYKPSLRDRLIVNEKGGEWMTANMGFTKKILQEVPVNKEYARLGDRELALKILKKSKIPFINDCIVYHVKKRRTIKGYLKEAERIEKRVMLVRDQDDKANKFRIIMPFMLLIALFPPAILIKIFQGQIRSLDDLTLLPFVWVKAVYMRYIIWKTAIKNRIFVI